MMGAVRSWLGVLTGMACTLISTPPPLAATSLPWPWVMDLQQQAQRQKCSLVDLRRSPPLVSPDGRWQVYSRLTLQVSPRTQHLSSTLFARDTLTNQLQVIYAVAPPPVKQTSLPLDFILLEPIAWQGNTVLIREHSGLFQSDIAEDQAVLWSADQAQIQILQPPPLPITELLDWDPLTPNRVLFAVGSFGEHPAVISVGTNPRVSAHSLPIDAFSSTVFTPPVADSDQHHSGSWSPGLPDITGPLCHISSTPSQLSK